MACRIFAQMDVWSDYRTYTGPVLHMDEKRVNQDLRLLALVPGHDTKELLFRLPESVETRLDPVGNR